MLCSVLPLLLPFFFPLMRIYKLLAMSETLLDIKDTEWKSWPMATM